MRRVLKMSGEVQVTRVFLYAEVMLRQGIRRSIATVMGPDGKLMGPTPGEYFAGVEKGYEAVMDAAEEKIVDCLESFRESLQLLKMDEKGGRRREFQSKTMRDRVEIVIRTQKKKETALAEELTARIQEIVDTCLRGL
ncbi:MAG: hypothetical protein JRF33_16150 [Deltaproteobacteria bacterium]|nr:hypothetical protein [Deltaproteobacteria bacterium]